MTGEGAPYDTQKIGALFELTSDAVVILEDGQVVAWNQAAEQLFAVTALEAVSPGARPLGEDHDALLALPTTEPPVRYVLSSAAVVQARRLVVAGRDVLVLRDLSPELRRAEGQQLLAALSRELLSQPPRLGAVLQRLCAQAKTLTGAAYSALVVLREGSTTEVSEFFYDAPRELFPARMPRTVGLLAVPISTRSPARLDDIRGHAAGVGLPGVHPPLGPLLAVPLVAGDDVLGEIAVSGPPGSRVFDEVDEALMVDLAAHTAVALRWAQAAETERERVLVRQEVVDTARHDIRTPVGAGKGYAKLLSTKLDRLSPAQLEMALHGLTDSFARIEAFSERLLLDERSATAGVEPQWELVELVPLLESLQRDAEVSTGHREVVALDWQPDAPSHAAADPEMLRQVLDNLVGNALKHAGSATVTVRGEGELVRFDIRDSGPGIPEAEHERLFDRWTRGDRARRGQIQGMGLGLSIVKRLVVAHGGGVGVSSRPGEGATFWVTFPVEVPA